MNQQKVEKLKSLIHIIQRFVAEEGWTGWFVPKLGKRMAAELDVLLKDVGDKEGKTDFRRGKVAAFQEVLQMASADLKNLQGQLEEAEQEEQADSVATDDGMPIQPI